MESGGVQYRVVPRLDHPAMDANAATATVCDDFCTGGFQLFVVELRWFHLQFTNQISSFDFHFQVS